MVEIVGMALEIEAESFASSSSSWLLELAANDDIANFKPAVELSSGMEGIDRTALWYCRQNGRMVLAQRTPAMIASLYGSLQVLKYILQCYLKAGIDINRSYGPDAATALHCAASSGVQNSVEVVRLLLSFGADPGVLDAHGQRPADVVVMGCSKAGKKSALESLLLARAEMEESYLPSSESVFDVMSEYNNSNNNTATTTALLVEVSSTPSSSPPDSPSLKDGFEKPREYPVDPYLPDIKNSVYSTDEFRMYSFKVRPCSRAYSHDWTECPFAHPGENARRRDPRRCHYSCVPCPDFRKGVCKRGDACEYAHGVFECWLHPAQYRTRLCKDGTNCGRRVCFFAHTTEELRPLYVSTGSAVPSPRGGGGSSSSALSPPMGPSSPSSVFMMSPFSQQNNNSNNNTGGGGGLATPPMSPSSGGQGGFSRQQLSSMPALHLPGAGLLQSSRLRTTLSARDMAIEEYARHHYHQNNPELDAAAHHLLLQDIQASMPPPQSRTSGSISARVNKFRNLGLAVVPTNLDEAFLSESPRSVHESALLLNAHLQNHVASESPRSIHESALLFSAHLQNQASMQQRHSQLHAQISEELARSPSHSASIGSPRARFSSLVLDTSEVQMNNIITTTPPLSPAIAAALARHDRRSHSSRDLGSHLPLSDWGSPTGKPEWGINGDDLSKFRKSSSFQLSRPLDDEPSLSWGQTIAKDSPTIDHPDVSANMEDNNNNNAGLNGEEEQQVVDQSVLGSWIEQMHLDQLIAQGEAVNWSGSLCR